MSYSHGVSKLHSDVLFQLLRNTYPDADGTTLSTSLDGQRVRLSEVGTPVTTTDWHNRELGDDDGGADGSCDFLGGLDSETDVTSRVTDDNNGLETCALTGTGLLLDGLDLFVGEDVLVLLCWLAFSCR